MITVKYNSRKIIDYSLNDLENSITSLDNTYKALDSLTVPRDFGNTKSLDAISFKINAISKKLKKLKDNIILTDNNYNKIINETIDKCISIDDVIIKKRMQYISKK